MTESVRLQRHAAETLAVEALMANRTSRENAVPTARALVSAEIDGQAGHGLSRVPTYAIQSRAGKVNGYAEPRAEHTAPAVVRIDADLGFAYRAIDLAIEKLVPTTRANGVGVAAIHRSHHFGQAGAHVERLAEQGLAALLFGNTPKAMAFWGATTAMLGTNPLAFAAPRTDAAPLVIDLALSIAARGKIVAAQRAAQTIPADWAVDREGRPTTDPSAALGGALLPIAGAKGGALALMIEVLTAALTGSAFGWESSSMFDDQGGPPNLGQLIVAFDPARASGGAFAERMNTLAAVIAAQHGARLPGERRLALRERAAREGVAISAALHAELLALAGNGV